MDKTADVIVPVLNGVEVTQACVESAVENAGMDFRFIFIDNGSDDGTQAYLQGYVEDCKDGQWHRYIRFEENRYVAHALNVGIETSDADYLTFINNDLLFGPDWLSEMVRPIEEMEGKAFCTVPLLYYDKLRWEQAKHYLRHIRSHETQYVRLVGACFTLSRKCILEVGPFDDSYRVHYIDTDYWLRMLAFRDRPVILASGASVYHIGAYSHQFVPNIDKLKMEDGILFQKRFPDRRGSISVN